jgi:hypothetical protein
MSNGHTMKNYLYFLLGFALVTALLLPLSEVYAGSCAYDPTYMTGETCTNGMVVPRPSNPDQYVEITDCTGTQDVIVSGCPSSDEATWEGHQGEVKINDGGIIQCWKQVLVNYASIKWRVIGCEITDPPVDCSDDYALKVDECGGVDFLENWDDQTCTGNCYCEETPTDNPESVTYSQAQDFCSGSGMGVNTYDKDTCTVDCNSCDEEYSAKQLECIQQGTDINPNPVNSSTCEYECKPHCTTEWDELTELCGVQGIDTDTWDDNTCTGSCNNDCTEPYDELIDECGIAGIASFNNQTCEGSCKGCEYEQADCDRKCGGFGEQTCNEIRGNAGNIISLNIGSCECADPEDTWGGVGDTIQSEGYAFGDPGQAGGTITNNPDGTVTETLNDGSELHYSADGKSIRGVLPSGKQIEKSVGEDENGAYVQYITIDEEGYARIKKVYEPDPETGESRVEETSAIDLNHDNPELSENLGTYGETEVSYISGDTWDGLGGALVDRPVSEPEPEPEPEPEEIAYTSDGSTIDITPITSAVSNLGEKFPVSALVNVVGVLDLLTAQGQAPTFTLNFLQFGTVDVDLSIFDPIATACRWLFMIALIMGVVFLIIKQWSN